MPVSLTKQKKKIHLSAVPTIPLQMLSRKERWAIPLSCVHHFVLITSEKTPCTWLSTSQMLTGHFPFHSESFFYCSFTNLLKWRLHYGKMVRIPGYSMAVRALYHSDGLVKSRLVDFKCFLSDQHTRLEIKKVKGFMDRDNVFCRDEHHSGKTVWGKDVFTSINIIHHRLSSLHCSAGVSAFSSCCI